jgi:hypothetical protein
MKAAWGHTSAICALPWAQSSPFSWRGLWVIKKLSDPVQVFGPRRNGLFLALVNLSVRSGLEPGEGRQHPHSSSWPQARPVPRLLPERRSWPSHTLVWYLLTAAPGRWSSSGNTGGAVLLEKDVNALLNREWVPLLGLWRVEVQYPLRREAIKLFRVHGDQEICFVISLDISTWKRVWIH